MPYLVFSHSGLERVLAWAALGVVLAGLVWLLAWEDDASGWFERLLLAFAGTMLSFLALRTATGRVVVDRVGVHVVDRGAVVSAGWDEIRGAHATREGNYPRLRVGPLEVDDFVLPRRARRRLADAVTRCLADPSSRPTAEAQLGRPFPIIWVCCVIALAAAALALWGSR